MPFILPDALNRGPEAVAQQHDQLLMRSVLLR